MYHTYHRLTFLHNQVQAIISSAWFVNKTRNLFVRVGLTTILHNGHRFIHPYLLNGSSSDLSIGHCRENVIDNCLYYMLLPKDNSPDGKRLRVVMRGEKDLKNFGTLRVFDMPDAISDDRPNIPTNAKDFRKFYHLHQFQLAFTICEEINGQMLPQPETTVYSIVITDSQTEESSPIDNKNRLIHAYFPTAGSCDGGEQCKSSNFNSAITTTLSSYTLHDGPQAVSSSDQQPLTNGDNLSYTPNLCEYMVFVIQTKLFNLLLLLGETCQHAEKFIESLGTSLDNLLKSGNHKQLFNVCRHIINKNSDCLLHKSIENGHYSLAADLIHCYRNNGLERRNDHGETPMLYAAKYNCLDLIKLFLQKRFELIYDTDSQMNNIFHLLAQNHVSSDTIEFLLNYLSDKSINIQQHFDTKNSEQITPLELAVKLNNSDVIKILKSSGHFRSNDGDDELLDRLNLIHITEKQGSDDTRNQ
ncbi:unnamed protein product, partial [Didymodactylos carnosus]